MSPVIQVNRYRILVILAAIASLGLATSSLADKSNAADFVVAIDGGGDIQNVQDAINAVP